MERRDFFGTKFGCDGQTTVPKEVREALHLEGYKLKWEVRDGKLEVTSAKRQALSFRSNEEKAKA